MRGKYTLREVPDPTDNLTAEELAMPNPRPRRKLRLVVEKQVDNRLKRGNSGDAPPLGRELVCDEDIFICIQREHLESGHKGGTGVYNNAKQRYAIPRYLVRIYVKICPVCKLKNKRRQPDGILHPIKEWLPGWKWNESSGELERVWYWEQAVHVCRYEKKIPDPEFPGCYKTVFVTDVIPRFWAFVLAIKDHYTRFLILEACESKCAGEVADRLREKFAYFGACTILSCDNGSEFKNDIMKVLMAAYPNSSIAYGKPYTPEHQGSVERANRDSKPTLEAICYERRNQNAEDWANWALAIPDAMESHNSMKFANGHKMTPIEAMTGRRPSRRPLGIEPPSDPTRPYTEKDIEDLLGVRNGMSEDLLGVRNGMSAFSSDGSLDLQGHGLHERTQLRRVRRSRRLNRLGRRRCSCVLRLAALHELHKFGVGVAVAVLLPRRSPQIEGVRLRIVEVQVQARRPSRASLDLDGHRRCVTGKVHARSGISAAPGARLRITAQEYRTFGRSKASVLPAVGENTHFDWFRGRLQLPCASRRLFGSRSRCCVARLA
eukprot:tig00001264_g7863.t1